MSKSNFTCPSCSHRLDVDQVKNSVRIWCAYGKCESKACNDAVIAKTETEAFDNLVRFHEQETQEQMNQL